MNKKTNSKSEYWLHKAKQATAYSLRLCEKHGYILTPVGYLLEPYNDFMLANSFFRPTKYANISIWHSQEQYKKYNTIYWKYQQRYKEYRLLDHESVILSLMQKSKTPRVIGKEHLINKSLGVNGLDVIKSIKLTEEEEELVAFIHKHDEEYEYQIGDTTIKKEEKEDNNEVLVQQTL